MSKKVISFYDSEKQSHDFPIITPDYGTCSTASNTSAKVVTCDDFSLFTGAEITVKFTNVPTTDTITLNVNNSGAKNVDFSACGNKPYDEIKANGCYGFVYDGTSWIYKGSGKGASKEELERLKYYGDPDIIPSDENYFTVNETGETITGLTDAGKTQAELVIPYKINGKEITSISDYAFLDCTALKSINIPNNVTYIGGYTFFTCASLKSINIPNSVTSIGNSAFSSCYSLTSITIPDSVTSISDFAFSGCSSLTSINIPNSVTSISNVAFSGCKSLISVNIPNSVTSIGDNAFSSCTSLISVNIPNSVTSIGDNAFSSCTNLTIYCEQGSYAETYAKENSIPIMYTDISSDTYTTKTELERLKYYGNKDIIPSDESYFTVNETGETITGLNDEGKTQTELVIPYKINGKEITSIGDGAFIGCTSLTSINIPNSVTSIGNVAFSDCTSLTSINIPNSITSISDFAFSGCTSLTSINIPNSVTSISDGTFSGCKSLTSINIPNSVTSIGYSTFYGCTSLTSINIPNGVTSIGDGTFNGCTSLTSINIPNSVTSIGYEAFSGCTSLTSINIPNGVTSIGDGAFSGCTSLTSINIPNSVTSISYNAFQNCTNLTLYCEQGSDSETYAKENNIPIVYTDIKSGLSKISAGTTHDNGKSDYSLTVHQIASEGTEDRTLNLYSSATIDELFNENNVEINAKLDDKLNKSIDVVNHYDYQYHEANITPGVIYKYIGSTETIYALPNFITDPTGITIYDPDTTDNSFSIESKKIVGFLNVNIGDTVKIVINTLDDNGEYQYVEGNVTAIGYVSNYVLYLSITNTTIPDISILSNIDENSIHYIMLNYDDIRILRHNDIFTLNEIEGLYVPVILKRAPINTSITVPIDNWTSNTDSNDETYYTKTITNTDLISTNNANYNLQLSSDIATARLESLAYSCIDSIVINDGSATLYCFNSIPTTQFQLNIQIVYS